MKARWIPGNQVDLLENGEEFFPRVFGAIASAQREVLLETFIWFEDKVGLALHAALLQAALRGASIDVTVDGFGSPEFSEGFIASLTQAGVRIHVFDQAPRLWGWRTNIFRRMHRKIVVVDGKLAFVGGINYSADHLLDYGASAKQDYAVAIAGPLVPHIRHFALRAIAQGQQRSKPGGEPAASWRPLRWLRSLLPPRSAIEPPTQHSPPVGSGYNFHWSSYTDPAASNTLSWADHHARKPAVPGHMNCLFVTRDNAHHTHDIEHHYRVAIRAAHHRVTIANAYFFPGYRLLRELRRAARRGVQVALILQGEPDMPIVKTAASLLYHHLLKGGVRIYEYSDRPLHGKVATSDSSWSTVGSSNLDPLSLSLNLEANVIVRDEGFNRHLTAKLDALITHSCREVSMSDVAESNAWRIVRSFFVFHLVRHYPDWAGWLPAHQALLTPAEKRVPPNAKPEPASPTPTP